MRFSDPLLPFIVLHNEVTIPANSFIRLPVRFVPVYSGKFVATLYGEIVNLENQQITIQFLGEAFF